MFLFSFGDLSGGKRRSDSLCAGRIVGIFCRKFVGEEEHLYYQEDDGQFDQNKQPQLPSDGHGAEAVAIKIIYAGQKSFHLNNINKGKNTKIMRKCRRPVEKKGQDEAESR